MNKKYILEVDAPNKLLMINNHQIRTPFKKIINENDILQIKMLMKIEGIIKYSITEYIQQKKEEPVIINENENTNNEEIIPKKIKRKQKELKNTILNSYLNESN